MDYCDWSIATSLSLDPSLILLYYVSIITDRDTLDLLIPLSLFLNLADDKDLFVKKQKYRTTLWWEVQKVHCKRSIVAKYITVHVTCGRTWFQGNILHKLFWLQVREKYLVFTFDFHWYVDTYVIVASNSHTPSNTNHFSPLIPLVQHFTYKQVHMSTLKITTLYQQK